MTFEVRPAVLDDVPAIVPWTTDTFDWGDYVPDRIVDWIESPDSAAIVCVTPENQPVAVAHAVMLSPTEGWLEAARVHPDHKRSGMGSAMNRWGVAWTKERGATVVRLATEKDNLAAQRQVEGLGYRATSTWVYAEFELENRPALPESTRLRSAPASDVDPAWMFWSTGDLYHDGRGLIALGWRWRRATPDDLAEAARTKTFYQSPSGWAIVEKLGADQMRLLWTATAPTEAHQMLDGLLDLATRSGASSLNLKTPATPWFVEAIRRAGGNPSEILVYSLPVK